MGIVTCRNLGEYIMMVTAGCELGTERWQHLHVAISVAKEKEQNYNKRKNGYNRLKT